MRQYSKEDMLLWRCGVDAEREWQGKPADRIDFNVIAIVVGHYMPE